MLIGLQEVALDFENGGWLLAAFCGQGSTNVHLMLLFILDLDRSCFVGADSCMPSCELNPLEMDVCVPLVVATYT